MVIANKLLCALLVVATLLMVQPAASFTYAPVIFYEHNLYYVHGNVATINGSVGYYAAIAASRGLPLNTPLYLTYSTSAVWGQFAPSNATTIVIVPTGGYDYCYRAWRDPDCNYVRYQMANFSISVPVYHYDNGALPTVVHLAVAWPGNVQQLMGDNPVPTTGSSANMLVWRVGGQ